MKNKWKNNADSPVLFFIDVLANRMVNLNYYKKINQKVKYMHDFIITKCLDMLRITNFVFSTVYSLD